MRPAPWAALLCTLLLAVPGSPAGQPQSPPRVIAIGDIHGAFDPFVDILGRAGLIDGERHWAGGSTTLVQTGDYLDRGPGVRAVMDLLMALEPEARAAGGRVTALMGNHEVMNLIGEQRDATAEIYATFADSSSEERREQGWRDYESLAASRRKARPELAEVYAQTREQWMAAHPPGWLEYRSALGPDGHYGSWLRKRTVSAQVSDTLFMHAGIDPASTDTRPDDVEKRVREQIQRVDRYLRRLTDAKLALPFFTLNEMLQVAAAEIHAVNAEVAAAKEAGRQPDLGDFDIPLVKEGAEMASIGDWDLLTENGPLWYRGYASAPEATLAQPISAMLSRLGLKRIVVAHTPLQVRRITSRLNGSVLLIDTGMLASTYKGRASALEIIGDRLTAIYDDGRVPLSAGPSPAGEIVFEHQRQ